MQPVGQRCQSLLLGTTKGPGRCRISSTRTPEDAVRCVLWD